MICEIVINGGQTIVLIPENNLEIEVLKNMGKATVELTEATSQILGKPVHQNSLLIRQSK